MNEEEIKYLHQFYTFALQPGAIYQVVLKIKLEFQQIFMVLRIFEAENSTLNHKIELDLYLFLCAGTDFL